MATNTMTVQLSDDRQVLLSYGTPVAAWIPNRGYVRTAKKYSRTTSKHATVYCGHATEVPHEEFVELVRPLVCR